MDTINIIEKVKSRKLAALIVVGLQLIRLEAPWIAFVILGGVYMLAEAVQMSAEKLAAKKGE